MKKILLIIITALSSVSLSFAGTNMDLYEKIYQQNRIESLLNRWWYFYETPNKNLNAQLDLFTEDFTVESLNGIANRDNYRQRVEAIPSSDLNAHHLERLDILETNGNTIRARAIILYQRLRNNEITSARLQYDVDLLETNEILPKIKKLRISFLENATHNEYIDRYRENRFGSLVKYFGALFDKPGQYPQNFDEIFDGNQFEWTHPNGAKMNLEQFKTYFAALPTRVKDSSHIMHDLDVIKISENKYKISFNFQWRGSNTQNEKLMAMSRHEWIVRDTNERYPVIESVKVSLVEPMTKI